MSHSTRHHQNNPRPRPRPRRRQRPPESMPSTMSSPYPHNPQLRLKCIVLGSANAGKTSLLRRFTYGTFEGGAGHPPDDASSSSSRAYYPNNSNSNKRRGSRSTTSTLGADYYVKKVDNPMYQNHENAQHDQHDQQRQSSAAENTNTSSTTNNNNVHTEAHVLVQLWDTAGKERLKPQKTYPADQYDKKSNFYQFLSIQPQSDQKKANNSTNYEHRYNNWGFLNEVVVVGDDDTTNANDDADDDLEKEIANNDPDTANPNSNKHTRQSIFHNNNNKQPREKKTSHTTYTKHHHHGHPFHYNHRTHTTPPFRRTITEHTNNNNQQSNNNKPMGDALFRNIDACMLVYDATSSMSFLHLMQWHSEWVQKLNHWEREELERNNINNQQSSSSPHSNDGSTGEEGQKKMSSRRKRMPFIVVANKLDILESGDGSSELQSSAGPNKRRSVLGFRDGQYKGRELKYEYAAENTKISQQNSSSWLNQAKHHDNGTAATGASTPKAKRAETNYPPAKRLTYSLKETLWSTDTAYLNALQLTEDQLHCGRELILLWCKRNGIPHVEASALDGRGVDEAMEHLIQIGVDELGMRESEKQIKMTIEKSHDQELLLYDTEEAHDSGDVEPEGNDVHSEQTIHDTNITQSVDTIPLHHTESEMQNGTSTQYLGGTSETPPPAATIPEATTIDPSQYYFLYQPRKEENLDLFARYSPKDEQRCSLFKCWSSMFSY